MEFTVIRGKIKALSPVHVGSGRQTGTFYPTLQYIPGRTVRGMLGNYLFHEDTSLFSELNINATNPEDSGIFFKPSLPEGCLAVPRHIKWCKRCGKLLAGHECEDGHEGDRKGGFIIKESLRERELKKPKISTSISTKCPIMRQCHSSPGSGDPLSPYNIEAIDRGTVFDFYGIVNKDLENDVIRSLREAGIAYGIGGFRSKGYGLICFDDLQTIPREEYIHDKLEGDWLVLNSPGVFSDDSSTHYYVGFDEQAMLRYVDRNLRMTGNKGEIVFMKQQYIIPDFARGWSIEKRSNLDRIIPAVSQGSSVQVKISDDAIRASLVLFGLGEMTHMGYGDIYFTGGCA